MSQVIREAVDLLLTVVDKIDARLREVDDERTLLLEKRGELVAIINGHGTPAVYQPPTSSEVRHVSATKTPAARRVPPPAPLRTGVPSVDAAARIEAAFAKSDEPLRWPDVFRASKLPLWGAKRLVAEMVAMGRLVRTGQTHATRYTLPSGRAKRGAAASAGKGSPADDDAHGAVQEATSAGDAGVAAASRELRLPQLVSRPPDDDTHENAALPPDGVFAESLEKGSIAHGLETDEDDDGLLDLDAVDSSPLADDLDLDALDDAQAELDDEPCVALPKAQIPKPKAPIYKSGHRQPRTAKREASTDGSWWMRPDADFAAEAERMRHDPRQPKTPGENNILAMKSVF